MTEIKSSEVSQILKEELGNLQSQSGLEETGTVLAVGDGTARLYGLQNVESGELIEFNNDESQQGIVLNLEEDNVGAVLLGSSTKIKEGDIVKRTNKIASIQVGEGMLGRVVNALGIPIDGKGPIEGETYQMPLERKAYRTLINNMGENVALFLRINFLVVDVFRDDHDGGAAWRNKKQC